MNPNIVFGLIFLVLAGVFVYLFTRQRKHVGEMSGLSEVSIESAAPGQRGIFKGTLNGVPVDVPYSDKPVVYFEYDLSEEVITEKDGKKQRRWKKIKSGKSKTPISLEAGGKSLSIRPDKFALHPIEIHNGRAMGLNKDLTKVMSFIQEGEGLFNRNRDLLTKNLKLRLEGLPLGQEAMVAGEVVDEGGALSVKPLGGSGGFLPSHNTAALMGKAKQMVYIFAGLAAISAVIGIYGIISAVSA